MMVLDPVRLMVLVVMLLLIAWIMKMGMILSFYPSESSRKKVDILTIDGNLDS
ncbi:hypothetical protein MKW98_014089, partial [Papaver atlanticum]